MLCLRRHRFFDIKIVLATWMSPEACLERKTLVRMSNTASMNFIPTHFFCIRKNIYLVPSGFKAEYNLEVNNFESLLLKLSLTQSLI